jgi:hypothetical protein
VTNSLAVYVIIKVQSAILTVVLVFTYAWRGLHGKGLVACQVIVFSKVLQDTGCSMDLAPNLWGDQVSAVYNARCLSRYGRLIM